jgi:aminopeptidase N
VQLRSASLLLLTSALIVGVAGLPATAAAAGPHYVAGAAGVGDPYYPLYGNGGYDVQHYRLKIAYDPGSDRLAGVATISARTTEGPYRFNLDLQGLKVRSVVVDGAGARWSRSDDHELIVTPQRPLAKGQRFTTVVRYDGVPRTQTIPGFDIESGFIHTDDGALIAGEPEVAANWYPVNDHPLDKASYAFEVTVPAGLQVIANGRLAGHRTKAGNTTWTWEAREPMASYLATASVGHYALHSYQAGGLRFYDAVDPDLYSESVDPQAPGSPTFGDVVDESFSHQRRILTFLAGRFGRYPFSTAGGSVDDYDGLFFALENQTRTVYSKYFFSDPLSGDFVIVHENAHQWYGDSVSVARWKDIWLNEGFATYAEWLWSEDQGLGTAQENFDFFYNDFVSPDDPFWSIVVADPGVEHLFDDPVYFRGAMTLHVLRLAVGDRTFFRILRGWARHKAGGNGTTEQFIAFAEKLSGRQLDQLFKNWLYTPGRPVLMQDAAGGSRLQASPTRVPAAAASELTRYRR